MSRYELNSPHLINAATVPCENQKPKMHVNTTSAFNVNYKIAVTRALIILFKISALYKSFTYLLTYLHASNYIAVS